MLINTTVSIVDGCLGAWGGPSLGPGARGALRPPSAMLPEHSWLPSVPEEPPAPGTAPARGSAPPTPSPEHPRRRGSRAQGARGCRVQAGHTAARCPGMCKCCPGKVTPSLILPVYLKEELACVKGYFCSWPLTVQLCHWCLNSLYHPSITQRMF